MRLTRRGLFGILLAAPLAKWLPTWLPTLPFTPRYYEVPGTLHLSDIDKVVLDIWMPRIKDEFFKADPLLAYLQTREHLYANGQPISEPFHFV
jgi:hypothetical protein